MEDQDIFDYNYELGLDEGEDGADDVTESGLSAVPVSTDFRDMYRRRLLKREEEALAQEEKDFGTVLSTIEKAKQRLLAQPTKGEELRNIAMRLTQPRKESDPRFYERRNLYTFLRDIGEYSGEQDAARKKAEEEALALDEMAAKYRLDRAQKRGSQASQLIAQYLSKDPAAKTERQSEFERLIAHLPEEQQKALRQRRAEVMSSRAPKTEKSDEGITIPQIGSIRREIRSTLSPSSQKLAFANEGLMNLKGAMEGNSQAEAQLNRSLASLSGDKALSLAEVQSVVGAGSFAERVANSISKFFTGGATALTNEQKKELLETYEAYYASKYNNDRKDLMEIYSGEGFEKIKPAYFGAPYVSVQERRRRKAEEEARQKSDQEKSEPAGITLSTGKAGRQTN